VKNSSDYSIAGRNLPGWAVALSERATGESSWALLGLPGAAYATGLTEIWTALGCVVGIITAWAGVGGTFSIVILFTLFWKRFHGKAALITIVTGMIFTILFYYSQKLCYFNKNF
jgi:Na+/proline symporter